MTNLFTYIFTNTDNLSDEFGGVESDIMITAASEDEALEILGGISGSRATNAIRDEGLRSGASAVRPATEDEVADYEAC